MDCASIIALPYAAPTPPVGKRGTHDPTFRFSRSCSPRCRMARPANLATSGTWLCCLSAFTTCQAFAHVMMMTMVRRTRTTRRRRRYDLCMPHHASSLRLGLKMPHRATFMYLISVTHRLARPHGAELPPIIGVLDRQARHQPKQRRHHERLAEQGDDNRFLRGPKNWSLRE
jgi:hypothetical protein